MFQAVNGPLQQRGSILDLDLTRANTFPIDYDTDLEFEWSNLSKIHLFKDKNTMAIFVFFIQIYLQMVMTFRKKQYEHIEISIIRSK